MPNQDTAARLKLLNDYRNAFWSGTNDEHVLLTLGESYQSIGCLDEAVAVFQAAAKSAPISALPHVRLAEAYEKLGRIEDAAFSYAEAAQVDVQDEHDAQTQVWNVTDELTDKPLQLAIMRRVCSRYTENHFYKMILAQYCHQQGEYAEAEKHYTELLGKEGTKPEERLDWEWRLSGVLIDSGKYDEGFRLAERVMPQLGSDYDVEYIERSLADDYLKAGRFESALEIYLHRERQCFPDELRAAMLRKAARCYEGLRQHDKAVECLIEILTFVREEGNPDDGWMEKRRVISDPRFYEDIYAALTRNYEAKGDLFRAKESFKKEKAYYARAVATGATSGRE